MFYFTMVIMITRKQRLISMSDVISCIFHKVTLNRKSEVMENMKIKSDEEVSYLRGFISM